MSVNVKSASKYLAAAVALGLCASSAFADGKHRSVGYRPAPVRYTPTQFVYARVVDVDPMVRYVTVDRPRQECWEEIVREPAPAFGVAGQTAAGAIVGAAIGRQFGSGNDRDMLTLLGAAAGGAVANHRAVQRQGYGTRDVAVQRCQTVNERVTEERVDGYLVTYLYEGRPYTMQTATHPGDRVQLAVDVRPVGYRVRY